MTRPTARKPVKPALALALTLAAATPAAAQNNQWATGPGGNSLRNCLSTAVGPNAPDLLWSGSPVADILETQPFIGDGFVVTGRIASFTIPTGSSIVAQNLQTGAERWRFQVPYNDNATNPDLEPEWRGRVTAARDDRVYVTRAGNTRSAPVYALDAADGSVLWTSQDLITTNSTTGNAFAPNGDLIVGSQTGGNGTLPGNILRIDHTDGSTVWQTPRSCPTSNGCLTAVTDTRVYYFEAGPSGPIVTTADLATGAPLYSTTSGELGGGFVQQVGLFVGQDGTIFIPRGQQGLPGDLPGVQADTFFAIDDTGSELNIRYGIPAGFVPFSTAGTAPDGSAYAYRTPEDADGDLTGQLIVLRLDAEGNIANQSAPLPTTTIAPSPRMAIDANGTIFLSTGEILVSLNADLTENWRVTDFADIGSPALGQNGVLVVSNGGTDMRAYQTPAAPACPGDTNDDNTVDLEDLLTVLANFGNNTANGAADGDVVPNGTVDLEDLLLVLANFGTTCP